MLSNTDKLPTNSYWEKLFLDNLSVFLKNGKFDMEQTQYKFDSLGVLEGICGAGLTLISYATGDYSWDECLMLND